MSRHWWGHMSMALIISIVTFIYIQITEAPTLYRGLSNHMTTKDWLFESGEPGILASQHTQIHHWPERQLGVRREGETTYTLTHIHTKINKQANRFSLVWKYDHAYTHTHDCANTKFMHSQSQTNTHTLNSSSCSSNSSSSKATGGWRWWRQVLSLQDNTLYTSGRRRSGEGNVLVAVVIAVKEWGKEDK